jgi:hypothetical protein
MKTSTRQIGTLRLAKAAGRSAGIESWRNLRGDGSRRSGSAAPITRRQSLVESSGFLVHTGQTTRAVDWRQLSDDLEREG